MKVELHPEVERDLEDAAAFYASQGSPALAARFLAEFERVVRLLRGNPALGTPRAEDRRGFPVPGFPYTVIYRGDHLRLRILVVKHDRRHPGFGGRRR